MGLRSFNWLNHRVDRCYSNRQFVTFDSVSKYNTLLAAYPAQQESIFTSLLKVCAASLSPSTVVR